MLLLYKTPHMLHHTAQHRLSLRCNTGEYPWVWVPVIFSKAITCTQRVFGHGYLPPAGDTTGYLCARVPAGELGYHYQDPWYLWYPLVRVRSRTPVATILATLALFSMPLYQYIMIYLINYDT